MKNLNAGGNKSGKVKTYPIEIYEIVDNGTDYYLQLGFSTWSDPKRALSHLVKEINKIILK